MVRFSLILLFVLCLGEIKAQNELFEIINLPTNSSSFSGIFLFLRQINQLKDRDLEQKDSIYFYKNDTLIFKYSIANIARSRMYASIADSTMRSRTDSVYNQERNSYDFYFTSIEDKRQLTNRKYYNEKGQFYLKEHYDGDSIVAQTSWDYNENGRILNENNRFNFDSSTYQMRYKWQDSYLLERHAMIEQARYHIQFTIRYDTFQAIRSYDYRRTKDNAVESLSFTVLRDSQKRATKIFGKQNEKPFNIKFIYEGPITLIDMEEINILYKLEIL